MLQKASSHLIILAAASGLAVISICGIIFTTPPSAAGTLIFGYLYASVWLAIAGVLTIVGILVRKKFTSQLYALSLIGAIRQGVLVASLCVAALALQGQGLLSWWMGLGLAAVAFCLEFFFEMK
jgi:hypothetical protein